MVNTYFIIIFTNYLIFIYEKYNLKYNKKTKQTQKISQFSNDFKTKKCNMTLRIHLSITY